ncbi:MAG: cytochrome P450 [Acidimicrobiales bacterium]
MAALEGLDITRPGFFLRDDYDDVLAWLRTHAPAHELADGPWLISTYDDIRTVSRRPDLFSSRRGALINDPLRLSEPDDRSGSLLHLDPPLHADYRKLLNRRFTPRATGSMEGAVRSITTEVLDGLHAGDEIDAVERIAAPIPVAVIAELLGVADGDRADFRRWSDAVIDISDHPDDQAVTVAAAELFAFLDAHVRDRMAEPRDDLISMLVGAEVGGAPLTPAQVLMFCITLLVAGNETTRSLLAGGMLALAEQPDQRATLAADESRVGAAVEECLRWVTPIQAFCRTTTGPVELGGRVIPGDAYVVMLYASGNRDETVFGPTARSFDIARPVSPGHLAFGFGEHLCLGAALARLEARVVLEELLRRFPRYEVTAAPTYVPSTLTRSIDTMPVRLV